MRCLYFLLFGRNFSRHVDKTFHKRLWKLSVPRHFYPIICVRPFMLFILFTKRFFWSGNPILGHIKIRFVSFQAISRKLNNKLTTKLCEDFARHNYTVSMKSTYLCTLGAHQYFKEQGISPRRSLLYHDKEMASSL